MNWILTAMTIALLIPIYAACQTQGWQPGKLQQQHQRRQTAWHSIWQRMLAFASIATKTSLIILMISVVRDDWMLGVVGVLILSVGNASLMLLAHVLRRMNVNAT
ncbi:MAG: hypothetical protein AAFQ74_04060 [Cyanobacteria bacterium J06623_4]